MPILVSKSCNHLFVKCIILQMLVNTLFFLINIFNTQNLVVYVLLVIAQLFLSLGIGLHIRKRNKTILLEQGTSRKLYAIISLVGLVLLLTVICLPDVIAMPYVSVTTMLYNIFGLDGLFTIFDFLSIVICLGSVFLWHGGTV